MPENINLSFGNRDNINYGAMISIYGFRLYIKTAS